MHLRSGVLKFLIELCLLDFLDFQVDLVPCAAGHWLVLVERGLSECRGLVVLHRAFLHLVEGQGGVLALHLRVGNGGGHLVELLVD